MSYLHSYAFQSLAAQSRLAYATDLRIFLSFLSIYGIDWRDASRRELESYALWRTEATENGRPVSRSRFAREVAAIQHFYAWQVDMGMMKASPVMLRRFRSPDGSTRTTAAIRPQGARSRVKWRTPNAYRRWRLTGLEGYGADGLRDGSWRGRHLSARNVAFAQTLWWSGVRLREAGTLLDQEVPSESADEDWEIGWIADAVAKGLGRSYLVCGQALEAIRRYRLTNRAESVRRAQEEGRYENLPNIRVASSFAANRIVVLTDRHGTEERISLDALGPTARRNVYVERDGGIEPAMLWLTQSGMPMPYTTWAKVLAQANRRCRAQGVPVSFTPHMMRHSFALKMLLFFLEETGNEIESYTRVQHLLGHVTVETTRRIYLEPTTNLSNKALLDAKTAAMKKDMTSEMADIDRVTSERLWRIVGETGLVLDVPR